MALWIPLLWMFFAGSRYVSEWLNLGAPMQGNDAYLEGNLWNSASFMALMIAGMVVLVRRRINWSEVFTKNAWIWLFFIYGGISILWSDYPFVSFKRLIKASGNVIMVLVILTDQRPYEAIGTILRRLAFVFLPLSVLFIKYYPDLGRGFTQAGFAMYTGVATQKNGLGAICLLSSIYFGWSLLLHRREESKLGRLLNIPTIIVLLFMIVWLFNMANSSTSLACMIVAICLFLVSRLPAMSHQPKRIIVVIIICIAVFGLLEWSFDIKDQLIAMLGRRPDLTTRVPMWEHLLTMVKNPIAGFGYDSFWLGDRMEIVQARWGHLMQAHNGYLEIYLNLGFIGLFIIAGQILSGLRKVSRHLAIDYSAAILRLCFIVVVVLYNYTEATFYGVSGMWVLFLLGVMERPGQQKSINNI